MKNELKPDFYYKYYIYASGVKSAVETFRFVLESDIDEEKLRDAVEKLIKKNPSLSLKPYITKKGRLNARADTVGVPVYREDGAERFLGGKDTYGYLFCVSFKENRLFLRIGHSLSDGRGMLLICQMLLYYYLENQYGSIDDEGLLFDSYSQSYDTLLRPLDYYSDAFIGETVSSNRPETVLNISGDREYLTTSKNKCIVMKTDLALMKETVKSFGTTPAVFISALLFEAVHNHLPSECGNVNLLLPVDLRAMLNSKSILNFCSSMQIDDRELTQCSFNKKIAGIKAQLTEKKERDYQLGSFKALTALSKLFDAFDLNDAKAYNEQRIRNSYAGKDRCTLLFTNIGKIHFPK